MNNPVDPAEIGNAIGSTEPIRSNQNDTVEDQAHYTPEMERDGEEMIKVYTTWIDGMRGPTEAEPQFLLNIASELEHCDIDTEITIHVHRMPRSHYDALPEFGGY